MASIAVAACELAGVEGPTLAANTTSTARADETTTGHFTPGSRSSSSTFPLATTVPEAEDPEVVAAAFVDRLQASAISGNYDSGAEQWSGYPYSESKKRALLESLVVTNPWLTDNQVRFAVVDAWSSGSAAPMKVVAITDLQWRGTTAILVDLSGTIQRIQVDKESEARVDGSEVTIPTQPVEGGMVAYLSGRLLPAESVRLDPESDSTIINLPEASGGEDPGLLIVSMATPELPTALSVLVGHR